MKRVFWSIFVALSLLVPVTATPASAADCQFVLGFKALHDQIPTIVGDCLVAEHYNPTNGDALQETSHGLLAWRKADNWTAFTDGYRTWINGPYGIQVRLNTVRFPWEADAANFPSATGSISPAPAPAPTAFVSFVSVLGAAPSHIAGVVVQTVPNATCSIDYITPHGTDSVAAGLVTKQADSTGRVGWAWLIGGNTYPGTGSVTVMCNGVIATTGIPIP